MTRDANGKTINIGSVVRVSTPWEKPGDEPVTFTVGKIYPNGVAQHSNGMGYSYNSDWVEVIDTEDGAPMTLDLAKLKEAAEKAKAARRNLIANQDSQDAANAFDQAVEDWCELANPSTILALIERLESAEDALKLFASVAVCYGAGYADYDSGLVSVSHLRRASAHMEKHNAKP